MWQQCMFLNDIYLRDTVNDCLWDVTHVFQPVNISLDILLPYYRIQYL